MKNLRHVASDYVYALRGRAHLYHGRKPPEKYLSNSSKGDVILIPGLYERWHFLKHIGDHLDSLGYRVHIVREIRNNRQAIHHESMKLHAYIHENKLRNVTIIAHSKGGLVGLHYMLEHAEADHVRKLIAIATPFSGSAIGRLVPLKNARELLPHSETISHLREKTAHLLHKVVSIYSEYDNHVWHSDKSYLKGAKNIELPIKGHHKILFDKQLLKILEQEL